MRMFLRHNRGWFFLGFALLALILPAFFLRGADYAPYATAWSFLPPLCTLFLLIATKEPFTALFMGILSGLLVGASYRPVVAVDSLFLALTESIGTRATLCILGSVVLFGCILALISRAGGVSAFGDWASRRVRSKRAALLLGMGLNTLFFFDDAFGCLTVGGAMRPVADRFKISRAKLSYVLNATTGPLCALIPLTAWAATAAAGAGTELLYASIPLLFYPIAALLLLLLVILTDLNIGAMEVAESRAQEGRSAAVSVQDETVSTDVPLSKRKGSVLDLFVPFLSMVLCFVLCFFYTGHLWQSATVLPAGEKILLTEAVIAEGGGKQLEIPAGTVLTLDSDLTYTSGEGQDRTALLGEDYAVGVVYREGGAGESTAASATVSGTLHFTPINISAETEHRVSLKQALISADPAGALLLGMGFSLILSVLYFVLRRTLSFGECMELLPMGLRSVAPTILLLLLSLLFGHVCRNCIGFGAFFAELLGGIDLPYLLPFLLFLGAVIFSLTGGSAVGTYTVLLPVAVALPLSPVGQVYAVAAVISGGVLGNHASLVSESTLLASAGAECNALEHTATQLPYVFVGGASAAIGFLVGGAAESYAAGILSAFGGLFLGILLLFFLAYRRRKQKNRF